MSDEPWTIRVLRIEPKPRLEIRIVRVRRGRRAKRIGALRHLSGRDRCVGLAAVACLCAAVLLLVIAGALR